MNILAETQYLTSRIDMKIFIIVLNRVYFLLAKVDNQSPFLGALILVTLLISLIVLSVWLCFFAFKDKASHMDGITYFLIVFIVFTLLCLFAKKNKEKIIYPDTDVSPIKNIYVFSLFIIVIGTFIFLSNINRQKVFQERKDVPLIKNDTKQSLESKLRKWLNN